MRTDGHRAPVYISCTCIHIRPWSPVRTLSPGHPENREHPRKPPPSPHSEWPNLPRFSGTHRELRHRTSPQQAPSLSEESGALHRNKTKEPAPQPGITGAKTTSVIQAEEHRPKGLWAGDLQEALEPWLPGTSWFQGSQRDPWNFESLILILEWTKGMEEMDAVGSGELFKH